MKYLLAFILFWLLVLPVAAIAGEVTDAITGVFTPLVLFGSSLVGSWVTGRVQKYRTKIPNDVIPATNTAAWGGIGAAVGGDPISIVAGVAGSLSATLIHQLWKKIAGEPVSAKKPRATRKTPR